MFNTVDEFEAARKIRFTLAQLMRRYSKPADPADARPLYESFGAPDVNVRQAKAVCQAVRMAMAAVDLEGWLTEPCKMMIRPIGDEFTDRTDDKGASDANQTK